MMDCMVCSTCRLTISGTFIILKFFRMYSRLSSTSDEDSDLIIKCNRKKQKKVAEYHWSDVTPQNVTCLPIGIDGL